MSLNKILGAPYLLIVDRSISSLKIIIIFNSVNKNPLNGKQR